MIEIPTNIIGYDDQTKSIVFNPNGNKFSTFKIYPFIEIDPQEIIFSIESSFKVDINHLFFINIKIDDNCTKHDLKSISKCHKFTVMPISIFLREIEKGIYTEAVFVSKHFVLIILGSDESWIIFESTVEPFLSNLDHLIEQSKYNIRALRKENIFYKFFKD